MFDYPQTMIADDTYAAAATPLQAAMDAVPTGSDLTLPRPNAREPSPRSR